VWQIGRRIIFGDLSKRPTNIASVFARPGIPAYIFLEGLPHDVAATIHGLPFVYHKTQPRLVPSDQRVSLLSCLNPGRQRRPVQDGQWVRCKYGMYRNDVGIVCGLDTSFDSEVIVAFVPRIPIKSMEVRSSGSAKRKRLTRPEARVWYVHQLETMWGDSQVRRTSVDEYQFRRETYKSGLVVKHLSLARITGADAPNDIGPFVRAFYTYKQPSFAALIRHFAQDSIKVDQRVRVVTGEQQGLVGYPCDIDNGVAAIVQQSGEESPPILVPLRSLLPVYDTGDHVKHRWEESHGIVVNVDKISNTLSFVEKASYKEVSTHMHANIPHDRTFSDHRPYGHRRAIPSSTKLLSFYGGNLGGLRRAWSLRATQTKGMGPNNGRNTCARDRRAYVQRSLLYCFLYVLLTNICCSLLSAYTN
jgi:hypothetical protein